MTTETYTLTRDAILASTVNHLTSIYTGNEIEETQGTIGMKLAIQMLEPKRIEIKEDLDTALLIVMLSKIIEDMDTEARMIQLLKDCNRDLHAGDKSMYVINSLAKLDITPLLAKREENLMSMSELIYPLLKGAGLESF